MKYYAFIQGYDYVEIVEGNSLRSVFSRVRRMAKQRKPNLTIVFARGEYPQNPKLDRFGLARTSIIKLNGKDATLMVTQFWSNSDGTYFGKYHERWFWDEED